MGVPWLENMKSLLFFHWEPNTPNTNQQKINYVSEAIKKIYTPAFTHKTLSNLLKQHQKKNLMVEIPSVFLIYDRCREWRS